MAKTKATTPKRKEEWEEKGAEGGGRGRRGRREGRRQGRRGMSEIREENKSRVDRKENKGIWRKEK